jgi:adenylate cyclase
MPDPAITQIPEPSSDAPDVPRSQPMCVLFADLAGSTSLFDKLGNTKATQLVTQCTDAMGMAVQRAGGQVIKVMGDGVLAVFNRPAQALVAAQAMRHIEFRQGLQVNVGIEHGQVVVRDQDVFGDAVNLAARLSDIAQSGEILLAGGAHAELDLAWQHQCRSLDNIALKGKAQPTPVWRLEPQTEMQTGPYMVTQLHGGKHDAQAAVAQMNLQLTPPEGEPTSLQSHSAQVLVLGRTAPANLQVNDARVSRSHASIQWQLDHFVISDQSSNGTWLRLDGSNTVHLLRRNSMPLVASGSIGLGADVDEFAAVRVRFSVQRQP